MRTAKTNLLARLFARLSRDRIVVTQTVRNQGGVPIKTDRQRQQYEHAIAVLVGQAPAAFSLTALQIHRVPPTIPVGLPSQLLERRPDIASAERMIVAANGQIGLARAAYFPNVSLAATGGYESNTLSSWILWPQRFWSIGASAAETLLDFGRRHAIAKQAQALYDAQVAAYRQTVLAGFQEVEQVVDRIVGQPATARFVSRKLAAFWLGADPPPSLVEAMARPDSPEEIATLPRLARADLPREVESIRRDSVRLSGKAEGIGAIIHPLFTNGIVYLDLAFPLDGLSRSSLAWLPLATRFVTGAGLSGRGYNLVAQDLARNAGGFSAILESGSPIAEASRIAAPAHSYAIFRLKALAERFPAALELVDRAAHDVTAAFADALAELVRLLADLGRIAVLEHRYRQPANDAHGDANDLLDLGPPVSWRGTTRAGG